MANLSHSESRRMYSWWWDSHISPKSSKWLQENLYDMDSKVKAMIKLIEEDADTFARRAEMYYKKRPELMKLVEEFYRAYRALAERYSSATGVLRQAHSTMAEVCPDQVPFELPEDSPGNALEADPHTPHVPIQPRAGFYLESMPINALELSSPNFNVSSLKQFSDFLGSEGNVRKGLNFQETAEKDRNSTNSEVVVKFEKDIQVLKDALAKLDAEKEAGLAHFQQSLERLSKLESEVSRAQEDSKRVDGQSKKAESEVQGLRETLYKLEAEKNASLLHYLERFSKLETDVSLAQADSKRVDEEAHKANGEVQTLKEALHKLEAEKEASFVGYQWSLERLSKLEAEFFHAQEDHRRVDERAKKAEDEVETLKEALNKLEAEKEESLLQYQECLGRIADLENTFSHSQDDADEYSERVLKAEAEAQTLKQVLRIIESEKDAVEKKLQIAIEDGKKHLDRAVAAEEQVEALKQDLNKLGEEKEDAFVRYQQCLESISSLEDKLSRAEDEVQRLNGELESGAAKLKNAEERSLVLEKLCETQNEELMEKQKEMGRLWASIQEERLRFMEAETAFQSLQLSHSQTQEELKSLTSELQNRAVLNQSLQEEVTRMKEKTKSLNEFNSSSAISMKEVQNEIFSLRDIRGKLEEEVELRAGQRNALQQEISSLKEELNELNQRYQDVLEENSNLKEASGREIAEKKALLEKMELMEELLRKNTLMENSLAVLSTELEEAREKKTSLEKSFRSVLQKKSLLKSENNGLVAQLKEATENLDKLSEKNTFLENSLISAHEEHTELKARSKSLEESCRLLENEKCDLINEKASLVSEVETSQQKLHSLEKGFRELEDKYSALEKERESMLQKVQELCGSLDAEKQERASSTRMNEQKIGLIQEHCQTMRRELEAELGMSLDHPIEIFILQKFIHDLLLRMRVQDQKEEALVAEIDLLKKMISELQSASQNLQKEIEEGRSSKNECLALKEEIRTLEGEIFLVLSETLSSSTLSLVLNNIISERSAELKKGVILEEADFESLHRREVLNYEVANGKTILCQKEMELSEVARKLVATEIEKSALEKVVAELKSDLEEVQMIRHEREMQILKLSENNHNLNMENECLHELNGARRSLKDGNSSRDSHIGLLQERVRYLEGENGSLKYELAVYAQAIVALKESVSSLENSTSMQTLPQKIHDNTTKGEEMSGRSSTESFKAKSTDRDGPETASELKDLLHRVRSAEKAVIKMKKIAAKETVNANAKLEAALNLIEELKLRPGSHPEAQPTPEPSEGGFLMKDIVLDKVSEPSSNRTRRTESGEADYLLESWDTSLNRSIGLTVGKGKKKIASDRFEGHRRYSSKGTSIEDLSVDKSEISRTPSLPRQEVNKRKILDRLNSDVQKLSNLHITVQDLTKRVDGSKKNKNHDEWDTLKDQLEEAEEAIQKLFEVQSKLKRNAEEKSTMEPDETGSFRRRKISEKAKRVSEKIGRLQLEVQKMQFVLLKLDDETDKGKKGRTRIVESKRRVLLRDYLYGGRTSLRKKRAACCGCVQPSTRDD